MTKKTLQITLVALAVLSPVAPGLAQEDVGMFGGTLSRNMVSEETNLPDSWDARKGENIKWVQHELGIGPFSFIF